MAQRSFGGSAKDNGGEDEDPPVGARPGLPSIACCESISNCSTENSQRRAKKPDRPILLLTHATKSPSRRGTPKESLEAFRVAARLAWSAKQLNVLEWGPT
jgi:hypothetical protein